MSKQKVEFIFSKKQLANFEECAKRSNLTLDNWVINQLDNAANKRANSKVKYDSESFQILLNKILIDVWRLNWVLSYLKELGYSGRLAEGSSLHSNLNKLPSELLNLIEVSKETSKTEIVVLISRLFDRDVSTNSFSRLFEMLGSIDSGDIYKSLEQLQVDDLVSFSSQLEDIKLCIQKLKKSTGVKDIVYKLRGKYVVHSETTFNENSLPPYQILLDAVISINEVMSKILELFKPMPLDIDGSVVNFNSSAQSSSHDCPANRATFLLQKNWYYEKTAGLLTSLEAISIKLQS